MRKALIQTLTEIARKNKDVYLLTGDLGFMAFEEFRDEFKERFINVGVAEQNMIGVAVGLALSRKIVFVYSLIPFVVYRCLEQIRNDICYNNLSIKVIGAGSGYSYDFMGPTHFAIEDIAIMSALPNMTVVCPGDPLEVKSAINASLSYNKPIYIRLARIGEPNFNDINTIKKFRIGKGIILNEGKDLTIITTGTALNQTLKVAELLKKFNYSAKVISMHTVKPIDDSLILKCAKETNFIFTIEEHGHYGGLGSIVARELMQSKIKCVTHFFNVNDDFAKKIGTHNYMLEKYGLSVNNVAKEILKIKRSF